MHDIFRNCDIATHELYMLTSYHLLDDPDAIPIGTVENSCQCGTESEKGWIGYGDL